MLEARSSPQPSGNAIRTPSIYSFFWQLYGATNDPAFAQVLYKQNDRKIDGLPHDLFFDDPAAA